MQRSTSKPTIEAPRFTELGRVFVERELGRRALLVLAAASALTLVWVLANVGYLGYLAGLRDWELSWSDRRFLEMGWAAVAGTLDFQLLVGLMVGSFVVAPTLACQSVVKETETRTLDALTLSPLTPLALHNGFTAGALAKVAPALLPALVVHLAIGALGMVEPLTTVGITALLLIGGWALTSLGTMIGLLLRNSFKAAMSGLVVVTTFGFAFGLPIAAVFDSGAEHMAMLSPAAAVVHTLVVDANPWLSSIEQGPELVHWLKGVPVPINPLLGSIALLVFFAGIAGHVGARRFGDALAPALSRPVALGSMVFVSCVVALLVVGEAPVHPDYWDPASEGMRIIAVSAVTLFVSFPFALLFGFGSISSARHQERARVWRSLGTGIRASSAGSDGRTLAALLLMPAVMGMSAAMVSALLSPMRYAEFGDRLYGFVPVLWGLLVVGQLMMLWRLSPQRAWQTGATLMGIAAASFVAVLYFVLLVDSRTLHANDLNLGVSDAAFLLSVMLMAGLSVVPFALAAWLWARSRAFELQVFDRIEMCRPDPSPVTEDFRWPEPSEHFQSLSCQLRPGELSEGDAPVYWLTLRNNLLELWSGDVGEGRVEASVDLSKPFGVSASVQPPNPFGGGLTTLNLSVVQSGGLDSGVVRFGISAYRGALDASLPSHDQRVGRLGPRDVEPVLAAIAFFAQGLGVILPRCAAPLATSQAA